VPRKKPKKLRRPVSFTDNSLERSGDYTRGQRVKTKGIHREEQELKKTAAAKQYSRMGKRKRTL